MSFHGLLPCCQLDNRILKISSIACKNGGATWDGRAIGSLKARGSAVARVHCVRSPLTPAEQQPRIVQTRLKIRITYRIYVQRRVHALALLVISLGVRRE
jgi:hypothetical protein